MTRTGRAGTWRQGRLVAAVGGVAVVLALTFSYTAVAALVPASVPQVLLVRTSAWAAVAIGVYAAWTRHAGRPFAAAWVLPIRWWTVSLAVVAVALVTLAIVLPPAGRSHADLVRVTIAGVVGEEVVFRGLLWEAVQALRHRDGGWPDRGTLAVTSVLFAISHAQYGGFRVTLALAGQVGYTLAAGVVLGWARGKTGSLALPVLLHGAGNAALKLTALLG